MSAPKTLGTPLTPEEKKYFTQVFKSLDPSSTGSVSGLAAKPLLEASSLPQIVLGQIWNIADPENTGALDQYGFCVAMRLIGHVQRGAPLNADLAHQAGPLPKFQGISINPTATGTLSGGNLLGGTPTGSRVPSSASSIQHTGSVQGGIVPPISQQSLASFSQMFDRAAGGAHILTGDKAKEIFLKAKLPNIVLGQIWQLVDREQSGELSKPEFIVAMHLIQCFLGRTLKTVPQVLAPDIWKSAETFSAQAAAVAPSPVASPAPLTSPVHQSYQKAGSATNWQMTPQERAQFDQVFDNLDKAKTGKLSSAQVAQFLMGSGLPNEVLANIWELANINDSDHFGKQEFAIALFLVGKKRSGIDLPESVPVALIQSVGTDSFAAPANPPPAISSRAPPPAPQVQEAPKKNDFDLLNDLFTGSQSPTKAELVTPQLTSSVTGTRAPFVPSSNFGQQMIHKEQQQQHPQSLLEESESSDDEPISKVPPAIPGRDQKPRFDSPQTTGGPNYDALRSFSQQSTGTVRVQQPPSAPASRQPTFSSTPIPQVAETSDVNETDREISHKLTQASVDIANFSNQINSLTNQTTQANEKREKANRELQKILKVKQDIQSKLTQLRALYEREVQQISEVESVLTQSRQETEKLRQESSIAEASYHAEQTKLQQMQMEFEEIQKENQAMKERLGVLNAEKLDISSQLEKIQGQLKQAHSFLSVTQQQVVTAEQERDAISSKVNDVIIAIKDIETKNAALLAKRQQIQDETDALHSKHGDLSAEYSTKSLEYSSNAVSGIGSSNSGSRGAAAAATVAGVAGVAGVAAVASSVMGHGDSYYESKEQGEQPTAELESDDDFVVPAEKKVDESVPSVGSPSMTADASTESHATEETPESSPANSEEFQFEHPTTGANAQSFNLPFARPESATSSVQNNAPMSVRGDFDVSEPNSPTSTIEEETASPSEVLGSGSRESESTENHPEHPAVSSGGESFEMVNADDAQDTQREVESVPVATPEEETDKAAESESEVDAATKQAEQEFPEIENTVMPGSIPGEFSSFDKPVDEASKGISDLSMKEQPHKYSSIDEELPPLQEKEPVESDSSDDSSDDEFHDTVQPESPMKKEIAPEVPSTPSGFNPFAGAGASSVTTANAQKANFDDAFDNLERAAPVPVGKDEFDEFDDLEEAAAEDSFAQDHGFDGSNDGFNAQQFFAQQPQQYGADIAAQQQASQQSAAQVNDEWEQIFAGFGNGPQTAPSEPPAYEHAAAPTSADKAVSATPVFGAGVTNFSSTGHSQAHELAIEELVAMGFDRDSSIDALQRNDWSIEGASNYLIDNA